MSTQLRISPDALTIGDLEDFEDVTGQSLDDALRPVRVFEEDEDGNPKLDANGNKIPVMELDPATKRKRPVTAVKVSPKVLKALVWISARKSDPQFTLEDARNTRVTELVIDETSAPKDEPTPDI